MCRHEYHAHYACSSSSSPIPGRLLMSPSSASMDPGKEALQLASNIARNVIPAGLERFTSSKLPSQPIIEKVSDRVICILGQNPSAFTLNGTNLYIVGTGKRRILIDAGETTPKSGKVISILEDLFKKEGIEGIQEILITHLHHDHYGGAIQIAKRFGCSRISKFPSPQTELDRRRESVRVAQINLGIDPNSNIIPPALEITYSGLDFELNSNYHRLSEGELIKSEGCNLRCFWTPGHAPDHLVFLLEEENSIFSGDHVLGWGTSWVEDLSL